MIKSSDKNLNNAYRIIKVLPNQDYLAIDQQDNHFIFSPTKNLQHHKHILQSQTTIAKYQFLLIHKQIINIDSIHYYVFEIGKQNAIWVKALDPKLISKQNYKFEIIKNAINGLLKDLLWMKYQDATIYMDIRNFWLINGKLYILLIKRQNIVKISLKRSQNNFRSHQNTKILSFIKNQQRILKLFALILWQIIYHTDYNQSKLNQYKNFVDIFLHKIIQKKLTYEQMKQMILIESQKNHFKLKQHKKYKKSEFPERKMRSATEDLFAKNRSFYTISKTMQSELIDDNYKMSCLQSESNNKSKLDYLSYNKGTKYIFPIKRVSTNFINNHNSLKIRTQKSYNKKFLQKRFSTISQKRQGQDVKSMYKKTIGLDEKIDKQSQSAKQRYLNTISTVNKVQSNQQQKQRLLKQRLIQKLKEYKQKRFQILKQSRNLIESKIKNKSFQQNKYNIKIQRQLNIKQSKLNKTLPIECLQGNSVIEENNKTKIQQIWRQQSSNIVNDEDEKISNQGSIISNLQKRKQSYTQIIQNDNKNKLKEEQISNVKNMKHKNKLNTLNDMDDQIQEIKFQKKQNKKNNNQFQNVQKLQKVINNFNQQSQISQLSKIQKNQNKQIKSQKSQSSFNFIYNDLFEQQQLQKSVKIEQILNYYNIFLNILGDISIKSIRAKDKLMDIQWKRSIYLLYERFYFQRLKLYKSLKNKKKLKIRNKQITEKDLNDWSKGKKYQFFLSKIQKQNVSIIKTYNKYSEELIKENKLQDKFIFYIKNREKLLKSEDRKVRLQLSKFIVICVSESFDEIIQKKINNLNVMHYIFDVLFGLKIIGELDNILNQDLWVKLQDYRNYKYTLKQVDQELDKIYDLYFPQTQHHSPSNTLHSNSNQ